MHSGGPPGFGTFEKIALVVKGVNVSSCFGSTVEEFRQYVNESTSPSILRFYCTPGQWSRDISSVTGRHVPVILVYLKYEDEGKGEKKNKKKEKNSMISWEEALTKCFTNIECDCVVVKGTNVVGYESTNSLGISDVVLSVGYNIITGDSPLGNNMALLYNRLTTPKDSAGVEKRGDDVMKRFGYRGCANVTSRGDIGKYANIACSADRQQVDSLCDDVASSMWAVARAMFQPANSVWSVPRW